MKIMTVFLFLGALMAGFILNPVFVLAKSTCYVDKDADDDGDGSLDEPYKKISKALDKECKKIVVYKGTYKDDIIIGKNVKLVGKDKDDVIITGKIVMKDGSEIDKVTVSGAGIDIAKNADVDIENSKIKDAHIGIETVGNGKLTVEDTSFSGNRKAMYLQRGKNVEITGCKVYNNSEEGIDIRANVDGVISGNEIYSNGESGIEVILGKSDLTIKNNSIKKNRASGIAAQFYTHASAVGGVKIIGNTISGNKDYGVNCKTPSGGNPGTDYWTKSLNMSANKIYDNKDGNFAPTCFFDDDVTGGATKTKEELEQERKVKEEKIQAMQKAKEEEAKKLKEEQNKKEEEELKKAREEEQRQQQLYQNAQNSIIVTKDLEKSIEEQFQKANERSKFLIMIIGLDHSVLEQASVEITNYQKNIEEAEGEIEQLSDEQKKQELKQQVEQLKQKKQEFEQNLNNYSNTSSIYKWILDNVPWPTS